jgi:hypothetical protein
MASYLLSNFISELNKPLYNTILITIIMIRICYTELISKKIYNDDDIDINDSEYKTIIVRKD